MEVLQLGVARAVITPKVGGTLYGYRPDVFSESVADDLTATAFYFRQGDLQALMVSVTLCLINNELTATLTSRIEDQCMIPAQNCMISATHTHSGPNLGGTVGWGDTDTEYFEQILLPRVLTIVQQAKENAQPVKMGIASGNSYIGINRRELTTDNQITLGQNPWGCFNPRMTVISFVNMNGNPVANMIHYGLHGTAAGMNHEITRDWSGVMIDTLEKQTGAITAFFNGPEGDVGPRISNGKTTGSNNMYYVYELGAVAAQDAVNIAKQIYHYENAQLRVSHKELNLPLKKRISKEEAEALCEKYAGIPVNNGKMIFEQAQKVLASYEEGYCEQESQMVPQTLIAFNNVVFAAFAYELFSEIGMRIDGCFDRATVLSLSNTNGSNGYFITEDAICRGGYEVRMFLYHQLQGLQNNADFHIMSETVTHVRELLYKEEK